jgi:hypothetical protein
MRPLAVLLALPLLAPALAADPPDRATAAEQARLEGTWKAVRVHVGKKTVDLAALEWSFTFQRERWSMVSPDGKGGGALEAGSSPATSNGATSARLTCSRNDSGSPLNASHAASGFGGVNDARLQVGHALSPLSQPPSHEGDLVVGQGNSFHRVLREVNGQHGQ